jgi:hypothetical protein
MTVRELIARLQSVEDQDMEVWYGKGVIQAIGFVEVARIADQPGYSRGACVVRSVGKGRWDYNLDGQKRNNLDESHPRDAVIMREEKHW